MGLGEAGRSVAVDSRGRIFVLDGQAEHIQVYSPNGIYEQTVGARGSGPGELEMAMCLGVMAEQIRAIPSPGEPSVEDPRDALVRLATDGSRIDTLMTFPSGKSLTLDGRSHMYAR